MTAVNVAPATEGMSTQETLQRLLMELLEGRTLASLQGMDPERVQGVYAVAHSLYQRQRYDEARKLFTYLMALDHHETLYMGAVASCLQMLKRYEEAIEYYSLASVYCLDDPRPTFHTAECLLALGRKDEAREALAMVLLDCEEPRHEALKHRAQAMLDFLDKGTEGTVRERMPP